MSYYALKDVDWPWDDEDEGRAIVVRADTPEEAVKIATAIHLADFPGAGGVTWDVARLNLVAFGDASWEEDNQPRFEALTYYADGINGPPDLPPALSVPLPEIEGGAIAWDSPEEWAIEKRAFHAAGRDDVPADVQQLVAKLWAMYCHAAAPGSDDQ